MMLRGVCPSCLRPVMILRTPEGGRVAVDPTPLVGGDVFVNGLAGRVLYYIPRSGPGSGELGWRRHGATCPEVIPRPRRKTVPV